MADKGEICPHCGSSNTVHACWAPRRFFRWLRGAHQKWKCRECRTRFRVRQGAKVGQVVCLLLFFLLAMGAGYAVVAGDRVSLNAKGVVIDAYRWIYGSGPEHKLALNRHWGWLYGDIGSQIDDYDTHKETGSADHSGAAGEYADE